MAARHVQSAGASWAALGLGPTVPALGEARFRNPKFNAFPKQLEIDNVVQRGYMRLLTEVFEFGAGGRGINLSDDKVDEALHHAVGAKLNFQFNPDSLNRTVTARTDTQLWINQNPSQLLQPGIGDMNFGWTMLFNREAEVQQNYIERLRLNTKNIEGTNESFLDKFSEEGATGTPAAAAQLGVLADIAILDRITGQSISKAQIDYANARQTRLVNLRIIDPPDEGGPDSIFEIAETLGLLEGEDSIYSANSQNAAFLIPNPIRAVFSQHFMVDGYVNTVTVSYQKFSPEMVPTVALVDISMHAIYQGFARRRTTFTTFLELAAHEEGSTNDGGEDTDETVITDPSDGVVHTLQEAGTVRPVLTGIDHSPPVSGWVGDSIPSEPETFLTRHHTLVGEADESASEIINTLRINNGDPAVNSALVRVNEGLSFNPISDLDVGTGNTPLGDILHASRQGLSQSGFEHQNMSGHIYMGLSIRARLKGSMDDMKFLTGVGQYADNAAGASGGVNGFLSQTGNDPAGVPLLYRARDGAFFGTWPTSQRRLLLGVGFDNLTGLSGVEPTKEALEDAWNAFENQPTSGNNDCFTRSFPITQHAPGAHTHAPIPIGAVGDLLHMKEFSFTADQIQISDDDHIFITDLPKWDESDMKYYIANGFWDKGPGPASTDAANRKDDNYVAFPYLGFNGTNYILGPQEYDLDDADVDYPTSGDGENAWRSVLLIGDRDFTVHYQMRVMMKVILKYAAVRDPNGITFSNTGWLVVHPRTRNSELVAKGWGFKWGSTTMGKDRGMTLSGELLGNVVNQGIPDYLGKGGDTTRHRPWQTGGDDNGFWGIPVNRYPHGGDIRGSQHFDGLMYPPRGYLGGVSQWDLRHKPSPREEHQTSLYIGRTKAPYLNDGQPYGLYGSAGSKFEGTT